MNDRIAFDDNLLSDITIKFSDETVRAHKVILYRTSGYFKKLFDREDPVSTYFHNVIFNVIVLDVVKLQDDEPDILRIVLKECYKDLNEDESLLLEMSGHDFNYLVQAYLTAHKYDIASVMHDSLTAIARLLNETDVSSLVASQWYVALDTAFLDGDVPNNELHDYLRQEMTRLMPVMMSDTGGYGALRDVLPCNAWLGTNIVDIKRTLEQSHERATKRRKYDGCNHTVSVMVDDGDAFGYDLFTSPSMNTCLGCLLQPSQSAKIRPNGGSHIQAEVMP